MTFTETAATPAGELRYTVSWRRVNGTYRVKIDFAYPIVATETINGVANPKVVRTNYAQVEFKFSELSTLQERKNIVGILANSFASSVTVMDGVLTKLEGLW